MCCCENETFFLKKLVISTTSWGWGTSDVKITRDEAEADMDEIGVMIDTRNDKSFIRLVRTDDFQCMESGLNVEIKFCPFCGRSL
jgi:hypothetical protein